MKKLLHLSGCLLFILVGILPGRVQSQTSGYRIVKRIEIGGEGGWDALTADAAARRLYVSHGTKVHVIDTDKNAVIGEIPNTPGVHDIALAPDLGRGFTSNGRDSSVTVFDLKTLTTITTIKVTGRNPDAIAYDPTSHRIFTFNGGSANATAIDAASGAIAGTIALGGRPEFAVADGRGRMYVNLEDSSAVVAFDARTLKVEARWPLAPGEGPSGLGMDPEHRRLFACCSNKLMVVLDADSGRVVATLPIGSRVDGNAYDPATRLAFSSNGDSTLTVVHEDTPNQFTVLENVVTRPGARTMALDEKTHRIYLPTAQFGPPPAPTPERPHPRPSVVPGSFAILVLESGK